MRDAGQVSERTAGPGEPRRGRSGAQCEVVAVVPVLDEAPTIGRCLEPLLGEGARVIVVDGGSSDATGAIAARLGAQVIQAPRGRASQMNAGAALGQGAAAVLLFVHADTVLPSGWLHEVQAALRAGARWGRFDVRLDSRRSLLRMVGAAMNLRSRLTGICTGDQALFVRADAWARVGGFAQIRLMEDIELSRRLRATEGPPAALRCQVLVSARRWERRGVLRTIAHMWLLRAMYFFGASPETLHRLYYGRSR